MFIYAISNYVGFCEDKLISNSGNRAFYFVFLPSFLSGTSLPLLNKILGLLPDQMLQMNQVVKFFNLYEIGGKVFCAVPILIISYSILLLLIVPVIYFIYRRKEVYN